MIKCIICSSEVPKHKPGWKQRLSCSPKCKQALINLRMKERGYVHPKGYGKIPIHYCETCGKEFHPRNNTSLHNPNRFCCRKCRRPKSGAASPGWRGGRTTRGGYILVQKPEHPHCDKSGYVAEHRLVMEEHLGRYLKKGERVHHVNGDRSDNRLQNLQLLSSHCHIKCPFCGRKFNPPQGTFI